MKENTELRNRIILDNLLLPYRENLPDLPVKSRLLSGTSLTVPWMYDIPSMCERLVSKTGGYKFVDESGRDFDNKGNSDLKIAGLRQSEGKVHSWSGMFKCSKGDNGSVKDGSIQLIVANVPKYRVDFFVLRKKEWTDVMNPKDKKIVFSYNDATDIYTKIQDFKIDDFEEFCDSVK